MSNEKNLYSDETIALKEEYEAAIRLLAIQVRRKADPSQIDWMKKVTKDTHDAVIASIIGTPDTNVNAETVQR